MAALLPPSNVDHCLTVFAARSPINEAEGILEGHCWARKYVSNTAPDGHQSGRNMPLEALNQYMCLWQDDVLESD